MKFWSLILPVGLGSIVVIVGCSSSFSILLLTLFSCMVFLGWVVLRSDIEKEETSCPEAFQFLNLSGTKTAYEQSNGTRNQTIVLIAGMSVPSYVWEATFKGLTQEGYAVIRYDFPGRGYSDKPLVEYNAVFYRKHLYTFLIQLKVCRPVTLIGLSFGAMVAADFVNHYPQWVCRVILIGPVYKMPRLFCKPLFSYLFITVPEVIAERQLRDFKRPELFPDWKSRYLEQMKRKGFRHAIISTLFHYGADERVYQALRRTRKPVLVIYGTDEATIDKGSVQKLVRCLKPEVLLVKDCGHLPHLEKAAQVNSAILQFLQEPIPSQ